MVIDPVWICLDKNVCAAMFVDFIFNIASFYFHHQTSYLRLKMFNSILWSTFRPSGDPHSSLTSEMPQLHSFFSHRLTSSLPRGKPTTMLKNQRRRRKPANEPSSGIFMRLTQCISSCWMHSDRHVIKPAHLRAL